MSATAMACRAVILAVFVSSCFMLFIAAADPDSHHEHSEHLSSINGKVGEERDVADPNPMHKDHEEFIKFVNENHTDHESHMDHGSSSHTESHMDHGSSSHTESHTGHRDSSEDHESHTDHHGSSEDHKSHTGHHDMMMKDQGDSSKSDPNRREALIRKDDHSGMDHDKGHDGHDHDKDHDGHGGHDGHDQMNMNGSDMHGMKMWFHTGEDETILFKEWKVTTAWGMVGSMIGILLLGMFYEGLKYFREYLFKQYISSMQFATVAVTGESGRVTQVHKVEKHRMLSAAHAIQTCLHVVQIVISYFLMLIFMTYNVWLCLAVVLGSGLGYFIFGWKKATVVDITEHCH